MEPRTCTPHLDVGHAPTPVGGTMRKLAVTIMVLFAMLFATAVQGQTVLRAGLDVDAGTMDPRLARDTSAARMQELVYSGLVRLDENLVPQPDLAASWEFTDPTTLVFELNEGVTFHNGQALTADDVAYTFETLLQEDFGAPRRSLYTPIESIDVVSDTT